MKKTLIGLLGSTVICVLFLAGCIDEHYGELMFSGLYLFCAFTLVSTTAAIAATKKIFFITLLVLFFLLF